MVRSREASGGLFCLIISNRQLIMSLSIKYFFSPSDATAFILLLLMAMRCGVSLGNDSIHFVFIGVVT